MHTCGTFRSERTKTTLPFRSASVRDETERFVLMVFKKMPADRIESGRKLRLRMNTGSCKGVSDAAISRPNRRLVASREGAIAETRQPDRPCFDRAPKNNRWSIAVCLNRCEFGFAAASPWERGGAAPTCACPGKISGDLDVGILRFPWLVDHSEEGTTNTKMMKGTRHSDQY